MRRLTSREYKVMLDPGPFDARKNAIKTICEDISDLATSTDAIEFKGHFAIGAQRWITFLDTPGLTFGLRRLILRRRQEKKTVKYTLKYRSEDRYISNGWDTSSGPGPKSEEKLEEDIAPPFRSRFSHSNTITLEQDHKAPETLKAASVLFPSLAALKRDGLPLSPETVLCVVNNVNAFEQVFKGPKLRFKEKNASCALILWSAGAKGRPLVAELSFRYKDKDEQYCPARRAKCTQFL